MTRRTGPALLPAVAAVALTAVLALGASAPRTTAAWTDPAHARATVSAGTWGPVVGCTVHRASDDALVAGATCAVVGTPVPTFWDDHNGNVNVGITIAPGATNIQTVYARATFVLADPRPGFSWAGVVVTGTPGTMVSSSCTQMPTLTLRVSGLSGSHQSVYLPLARTGCAR
ncbi:hypothetical protein H9657_03225 [Cellulomonas sp. Sa3CUA2]|uniref:Secreted protein n=1 Tax=Cellulomonas avistercoris TaxID=2762242 RepID=A0ABR8QA37_9CELL|nr:hypothetical protein [Cellulomonas avistercoris]MBD7917290.1 hypothetical protein [Cellulomonas avistercoris]